MIDPTIWEQVMELARAAISAADPERLVREFFTLPDKRSPGAIRQSTEASRQPAETSVRNSGAGYESAGIAAMEEDYDLSSYKRIFVLGAGKAAGFMARGVENALVNAGPGWEVTDRPGNTGLSVQVTDGLVVVKDGYGAPGLERVRQVEASHPIPDERGAAAERYSLKEKFAPAVLARLEAGARGEIEETPKPGDPVFARVKNHVLCSNRDALDAAAEMAVKSGLRVIKIEEPVTGESRDAARRFVAMASEMLEQARMSRRRRKRIPPWAGIPPLRISPFASSPAGKPR